MAFFAAAVKCRSCPGAPSVAVAGMGRPARFRNGWQLWRRWPEPLAALPKTVDLHGADRSGVGNSKRPPAFSTCWRDGRTLSDEPAPHRAPRIVERNLDRRSRCCGSWPRPRSDSDGNVKFRARRTSSKSPVAWCPTVSIRDAVAALADRQIGGLIAAWNALQARFASFRARSRGTDQGFGGARQGQSKDSRARVGVSLSPPRAIRP